ncbi:hypothetical protein CRM22_002669 [Opisthorchis felineus]|uniref:HORMA domain-containing protein n=1 Tax=Opisthorchis felineus TaxID=147828 RepID=A0A4S2MB14_OPIFE|nr:hypothetical protein CRM22_002669 [Opisthorchis felineus]
MFSFRTMLLPKPILTSVCDPLCDFVESAIHLYLYQRGVYPRCSFSDFSIFGIQIQFCNNPDVKKYIFDCVESLRPRLPLIREIRILLKAPDPCATGASEYLESLALRFERIDEALARKDMLLLQLQEHFATALIRLNLLECTYPPIDVEERWVDEHAFR